MIKCAIFGCGFWGTLLTSKIIESNRYHLRYLVDTDEELLAGLKERYGFVNTTSNVDEVLKDMHLELVFLLTPNATHYELAKRILEAGKSIYVEQPFVLSVREFDELIELAHKHKAKIIFGDTNPYNRAIDFIKNEIASEELGHLYYVHSQRLNYKPIQRNPDAVVELGIREVVLAKNLFRQPIVKVLAIPTAEFKGGATPAANIFLGFADGMKYSSHLSVMAPQRIRELVLIGSKKMLRFDDTSFDRQITEYSYRTDFVWNPRPDSLIDFSLETALGSVHIPHLTYQEPLKQLIPAVADFYAGPESFFGLEFNREVVQTLEALIKASSAGTWIDI